MRRGRATAEAHHAHLQHAAVLSPLAGPRGRRVLRSERQSGQAGEVHRLAEPTGGERHCGGTCAVWGRGVGLPAALRPDRQLLIATGAHLLGEVEMVGQDDV